VSTRAKFASVALSAGILLLGWQVGGRTLTQGGSSASTAGGTTNSAGSIGTTSNASGTANGGTSTGNSGAAAGGYRDGAYKGKASSNRYEAITVTVTISGGKITDATATVNGGNFLSQNISSQAIQQLKSDVLSAQSAKVSTVSGATYSSMSYLTSLQSALDQARA